MNDRILILLPQVHHGSLYIRVLPTELIYHPHSVKNPGDGFSPMILGQMRVDQSHLYRFMPH